MNAATAATGLNSTAESRRYYYLQQMGIEPWMLRTKHATTTTASKQPLIVCSTLTARANRLLERMLKSIGLSTDCVGLVQIETADRTALDMQLNQREPSVILILGEHVCRGLSIDNAASFFQKIPLLVSFSPDYLLQSPHHKKQAFADLLRMKRQFCPTV